MTDSQRRHTMTNVKLIKQLETRGWSQGDVDQVISRLKLAEKMAENLERIYPLANWLKDKHGIEIDIIPTEDILKEWQQ